MDAEWSDLLELACHAMVVASAPSLHDVFSPRWPSHSAVLDASEPFDWLRFVAVSKTPSADGDDAANVGHTDRTHVTPPPCCVPSSRRLRLRFTPPLNLSATSSAKGQPARRPKASKPPLSSLRFPSLRT
jgi:hypothetical protein